MKKSLKIFQLDIKFISRPRTCVSYVHMSCSYASDIIIMHIFLASSNDLQSRFFTTEPNDEENYFRICHCCLNLEDELRRHFLLRKLLKLNKESEFMRGS